MKNKKIFGVLSLIIGVVGFISTFFSMIYTDSLDKVIIIFAASLFLFIIGLILGIIGIKNNKTLSIIGIVLNSLSLIFYGFMLMSFYTLTIVNNCVRTQNDTTTCELNGVEIKDIPTSSLRDDQYKDSEGE